MNSVVCCLEYVFIFVMLLASYSFLDHVFMFVIVLMFSHLFFFTSSHLVLFPWLLFSVFLFFSFLFSVFSCFAFVTQLFGHVSNPNNPNTPNTPNISNTLNNLIPLILRISQVLINPDEPTTQVSRA